MSNTKLTLLVPGAFRYSLTDDRRNVFVHADESGVTMWPMGGSIEITFTREDWQAIQEYIIAADWDNQVGASDTSPTQDQPEDGYRIDWSAIPLEYGWVAVAQNGTAWAYGNKPGANCDAWWVLNDPVTPIEINEPGIVIAPEGIDWRDSLRQRPF